MRRIILLALVALALPTAALASSIIADPITVRNPSFERVPRGGLPDQCPGHPFPNCAFSLGQIPGWTSIETNGEFQSGQFRPGSSGIFTGPLPNGIVTAYSNGPTISQFVGDVQKGVTYTFTVFLGLRNGESEFASAADFLVGGHEIHPATGTDPHPGHWSMFTATFTGNSSNAGEPITIQLRNIGDHDTFEQANFDDVHLTAAATPEPSTLMMLGTGLLLVFGMARRRYLNR